MELGQGLDMLAFSLKMLARETKKRVLISAGKPEDKERLLAAVCKLVAMGVELFATEGTHEFFQERGVPSTMLHKISERTEPNILSLLDKNRLDLVINILNDGVDYDAQADSRHIRALVIGNSIPLITDVDVVIQTVEAMEAKRGEQAAQTSVLDDSWNLRRVFEQRLLALGGAASHHHHLDKALLINPGNLRLGMADMQQKWALYDHLKATYTMESLVARMSRCLEILIAQGVTYCRTLVDADSTVQLLPIRAALEVRKLYAGRIILEIGVQPLQGVLNLEARKYFDDACAMADYIGGLPSKDRPTPEAHIEHLLRLARELNKPVDVHVDQENNPDENETEMLAVMTEQYGLGGRVNAIHSISVSAKQPRDQRRILDMLKDSGVGVIVCPSAGISMKSLPKDAPLHNSIAPVPAMLDAGITVSMGIDNMADLFMPLADGDLWFEARLLMEACRFYDLEAVAAMFCRRPACGLMRTNGTKKL